MPTMLIWSYIDCVVVNQPGKSFDCRHSDNLLHFTSPLLSLIAVHCKGLLVQPGRTTGAAACSIFDNQCWGQLLQGCYEHGGRELIASPASGRGGFKSTALLPASPSHTRTTTDTRILMVNCQGQALMNDSGTDWRSLRAGSQLEGTHLAKNLHGLRRLSITTKY